jgi:hypothetical protein
MIVAVAPRPLPSLPVPNTRHILPETPIASLLARKLARSSLFDEPYYYDGLLPCLS